MIASNNITPHDITAHDITDITPHHVALPQHLHLAHVVVSHVTALYARSQPASAPVRQG